MDLKAYLSEAKPCGNYLRKDLIKTGQVNGIKGLERDMCVHGKHQPDLTCKRIIRISRLNIAPSGLAASEMTFVWRNGDSRRVHAD